MIVVGLVFIVSVLALVQAHAALGKPALKTIASIVVHAHHHAYVAHK
jgi:hypothetical protein